MAWFREMNIGFPCPCACKHVCDVKRWEGAGTRTTGCLMSGAGLSARSGWGAGIFHESSSQIWAGENKRPGKKTHVCGKRKNMFDPNKVVVRSGEETSCSGAICPEVRTSPPQGREMLTGAISGPGRGGNILQGAPAQPHMCVCTCVGARAPEVPGSLSADSIAEQTCEHQSHRQTPLTASGSSQRGSSA